jgi:Uma2 family endonuclease
MSAATIHPPTDCLDQHFIIDGVDWAFYDAMLKLMEDRRVFITYDRGRLELMSPSQRHEKASRRLGVLVNILCEELDIDFDGLQSTTLRREDLDRGCEPDQCFYIQNLAAIRGKAQLDLPNDPPPDLVVEIEVSRRLSEREAICAELGVPELWRHDGIKLRVFTLDAVRTYVPASRSRCLPSVPLEKIEWLVAMGANLSEGTWTKRARQWIRENLLTA